MIVNSSHQPPLCQLPVPSPTVWYATTQHAAVDPEAISESSSVQPSSDASTPRLRLQNGAHISVRLIDKVTLSIDFTVEAWFRLEVSLVTFVFRIFLPGEIGREDGDHIALATLLVPP